MKRKICWFFLIVAIQIYGWTLELRVKDIFTNINGHPANCLGAIRVLFDEDDVIFISMGTRLRIDKIKDEGQLLKVETLDFRDSGIPGSYNQNNVIYELKYGYNMFLSSYLRTGEIIMSDSYRQNKPSMFNHSDNFQPIPYFFYIKNENDEYVFDLNKFRLDHEEFYPKGHYTSTSRYEEFSKEEAKRQLANDSAWTMYQGCTAVNRKQNRIAIILNQYNVYDDALVIFEVLYNAVCNDDKVRVRTEPNLNCETICFLNKNDAVKIQDQSEKKFEIAGEKWYWHQVETSDGKTGWVYGKYLDIEK